MFGVKAMPNLYQPGDPDPLRDVLLRGWQAHGGGSNDAHARRLGKAVALLASPQDSEVLAAARTIGRTLDATGMDWRRLAAPAFTFAGLALRTARKLMAHLAREPGATAADRLVTSPARRYGTYYE